MSRINTNVDSLIALNNLTRTNKDLGTSLTRLSTGLRVNSGKDDPAGLISGETLRQEISSTRSAIANNNRTNNLLSTADNALSEIGSLLDKARAILTTSENKGVLSQSELEANQASIDAAVASIERIAGTTQFAGRKLLDGSLGFQISGINRFDAGNATFTNVRVNLANFDAAGSAVTVNVTLTTKAAQASVALEGANATVATTIEVTGNQGSATVNIASGQGYAAAINAVSDVTGVQVSGTNAVSVGYGQNAQVRIRSIVGNALSGSSEKNDTGDDAVGTINGQAFEADGLRATLKTAGLEVEVTFSAGTANSTNQSFQITGGGARFQLGGEINSANQTNLGLQSFFAGSLGHINIIDGNRTLASIVTGGSNSLVAAPLSSAKSQARIGASIIHDAIDQVASARARVGAFQAYTIESNLNALGVRLENLSAARSQIIDTDFAEETATLTRLQILVQAGTSSLAIANSRPQGVLTLLGS